SLRQRPQPDFQILKVNLNFLCSSHDRQSTNRTPPTTTRPNTINRIPFGENAPCRKSLRFAAAYSPANTIIPLLMSFPQKNGGSIHNGRIFAIPAAVNSGVVDIGVNAYRKTK